MTTSYSARQVRSRPSERHRKARHDAQGSCLVPSDSACPKSSHDPLFRHDLGWSHNDTPVAPHIRRGGRALVAMLDLGNAGERLFVSSPPVVFPALGGGRQIERGKINHTVDAKSVRRSVLSALRRISLSSTGKEAKMNHESGYGRAHRQAEHIFRNLLPAHGMAVREGQIALCHAMPPRHRLAGKKQV